MSEGVYCMHLVFWWAEWAENNKIGHFLVQEISKTGKVIGQYKTHPYWKNVKKDSSFICINQKYLYDTSSMIFEEIQNNERQLG